MTEKIELTSKKEVNPNWIRPDLKHERGEIERVLRGFLGETANKENMKRIMDILENAPMVELSEKLWESIDNTDSFHNIRPGHPEDAETKVEEYNQELAPENKRNFKRHLKCYLNGTPMETPIIIKNKEGILHLVSGNTRLMVARALGVKPKVVIGEYN